MRCSPHIPEISTFLLEQGAKQGMEQVADLDPIIYDLWLDIFAENRHAYQRNEVSNLWRSLIKKYGLDLPFQLLQGHPLEVFKEIVDIILHDHDYEWELDDLRNNVSMVLIRYPFESYSEKSFEDYLADSNEVGRLMSRLGMNFQSRDEWDCNCLHLAFPVFVTRRNDLNQRMRVRVFLSRLLRYGADPCATDVNDVTPTMLALVLNWVPEWFGALAENGISIDKIAHHTVHVLGTESRLLLLDHLGHLRNWYEKTPFLCELAIREGAEVALRNLESFKSFMYSQFAQHGCYPDPYTSSDEEPNVYSLSTSAVDFKPSTVYDPDRAVGQIRRRVPGITGED